MSKNTMSKKPKNTTPQESNDDHTRTMGRFSVVEHGLYQGKLQYNPILGAAVNVTERDLMLVWEGHLHSWEYNPSVVRSNVRTEEAFVLDTGSRELPHININKVVSVKPLTMMPSRFEDYQIDLNFPLMQPGWKLYMWRDGCYSVFDHKGQNSAASGFPTDPTTAKKALTLINASMSNINGDPLRGGAPHIMWSTGHGYATNVSQRRGARTIAQEVHNEPLWVTPNTLLYAKAQDFGSSKEIIASRWDARVYGIMGSALFSKEIEVNRSAPVAVENAMTVSPVIIHQVSITSSSRNEGAEAYKKAQKAQKAQPEVGIAAK